MNEPIIDAHHHIWRKADLPWLEGPMQPRIFGPYEPIRRDYPITEYLEDIAGTGIERSVYVQTNWAPSRFLEEAAWVQRTAEETGWPHGLVACADLLSEDARPELDRLAAFPLMRGVRTQLHWHDNPMYRFAERPDVMKDARFTRNLAHLAKYGWTFDLQVFPGQMDDAAALARQFSGIIFLLQHAGMLDDTSAEGRNYWRAGMLKLAAQPNVMAKLSGLGTFIHRNDPEHIAVIVAETVAMFGAERCLFGSNFPIEKLWTDYAALVAAFRNATKSFSKDQRRDIFWNSAARVYRLA